MAVSHWIGESALLGGIVDFRAVSPMAPPVLVYFANLFSRGRMIMSAAFDKGGHFAVWEQSRPFTEELRAAFRYLR
jgi:hypothetical protein